MTVRTLSWPKRTDWHRLTESMPTPLRLCLDLNVWCASFLADRAGRNNTSAQRLVSSVRSGLSPLGPVQLVISWGMLNRLRKVFILDWNIDHETTDELIQAIVGYANLGPGGMGPQLTLGGTGLMPIRDDEDAHVLDTAIAASADILVTANMADFLPRHIEIIAPERLARFVHPKKAVLIAHPFIVRDWFDA